MGSYSSPTAQNTVFGWILTGSIETPINCHSTVTCHIVQHQDPESNLTDQLKRFWEMEEPPASIILSPEEDECEKHFQSTHSRDMDGRYDYIALATSS